MWTEAFSTASDKPVAGRARCWREAFTFGADFGTASTEFIRPPNVRVGRQMQTWVRFAAGWRVVAAHVSFTGD